MYTMTLYDFKKLFRFFTLAKIVTARKEVSAERKMNNETCFFQYSATSSYGRYVLGLFRRARHWWRDHRSRNCFGCTNTRDETGLIEMQDFAAGTSSRSTKLIHGGLRYLKQFEIKEVAEIGKERAVV